MKIGLINNLYKPYQKGGAERIVELLNNELQTLGHEVFLISTRPKEKKDGEEKNAYYLASNYSQLGNFSILYRAMWQITNLFNLKKYYELKKVFSTEKPELIITNNLMGLGLLTSKAIKKSGAKHIHVLHDIQLLHPSGLMYFGQENIISSLPAKIYQKITNYLIGQPIVVSPSKWLLELHKAHGFFKNTKSQAITNPFNYINNLDTKKNESRDFIFIGQLEYHKGLDLFIEAAARFTDYNFLVVGDGSLKIKGGDNVKLLGRKSSSEVSDLLKNSLAVIIPSRCYENSPTVIYEAAAVGTPAIAADLGGIPELIERFGGLLFEPNNTDSLVMTIEQFLEHGVTLKPPVKNSYAKEILALL